MMRRAQGMTRTTLVLVGVLAFATACADPCTALAERTCARAGRQTPLCTKLQAIAAAPQAGDRQACESGVAFIDELERQ